MVPRSSDFYFLALRSDAYQQLNPAWNNLLAIVFSHVAEGGLHSPVKCLQF